MSKCITVAAVAATFLSAASARADVPRGDARRLTITTAVVRPDSLRIARALADAERFAAAGRTGDARRAARIAIGEQEADGESTARAYWLVATAYYADGDEVAAARSLDRAAQAAAEFADPTTELTATFEAVVLYARHGMNDEARAGLVRVRRLLKSPAIADDLKASIERRIVGR